MLFPENTSFKNFLSFFSVSHSDLPKLTPKKTVVRVSWESSKNTTASGNLIFPADFDGKLETEIATSELLDYYGCMFADGRPEEVNIPYRHVIQDFTYEDSYLINYVT